MLGVVQREERSEVLKTTLLMEAALGNEQAAREMLKEYVAARLPFTESNEEEVEKLKEDTLKELGNLEVHLTPAAFSGSSGELPDQEEAWKQLKIEYERSNKGG